MHLKLANDYFDCDPERFPRRGSEGKFCFPEGPLPIFQGWVGGGVMIQTRFFSRFDRA